MHKFLRTMTAAAVAAVMAPAFAADAVYNVDVVVVGAGAAAPPRAGPPLKRASRS